MYMWFYCACLLIFIPYHRIVVGYYGFTLDVSTYIDIRRSGLGLLRGKFCQCLTDLSACKTIMAGYYSLTFLFLIFSALLT